MANVTSSGNPTYCFLDTNVLIHKQTFDEVDWPGIVGTTDVCLVLAPMVVKELERHKNEGKNEWVQSRARTLISKLKPHLRDPHVAAGQAVPIRPHVKLLYLTKEPTVDWAHLGLDAGWNDDRLIASVIEFIREHPATNALFAADDTLCLAKALAHGIQTVDTDRIPSQKRTSSEAAENAKLRRQVEDLTNRAPKLQLRFLEGGQPTTVAYRSRTTSVLPTEALETFIAETLVREQEALNVAMARGHELLAAGTLKASELDLYEQEYTDYLHLLPAWLPLKWSRAHGPVVDLWFVLDNSGTLPATDARLSFTFPYSSFVMPRDGDLEVWGAVLMPERPEAEWMKTPPPAGSWPSALSLTRDLALITSLHLPTQPAGPPRPTGPVLSLDTPERHKVTYSNPKLIQGGNWPMEPVRVYLPPSTSEAFQIAYQLRADELPQITTATLAVKLVSPATALPDE